MSVGSMNIMIYAICRGARDQDFPRSFAIVKCCSAGGARAREQNLLSGRRFDAFAPFSSPHFGHLFACGIEGMVLTGADL